jgi:hypothetical protein
MRWTQDDILFLQRTIAHGDVVYANRLLAMYPGLPCEAAARLVAMLEQWLPASTASSTGGPVPLASPVLRDARSELLQRLARIVKRAQSERAHAQVTLF